MSAATEFEAKEEKERFRVSVGVTVSTPVGVGGSVSASHEQGSGKSTATEHRSISESMVFEATGGNTLLASDPQAWAATVPNSNNWRVIDQSDFKPLIEVISEIPQYSQVPVWFMQAVPVLSKYISIPRERTLDFRFKLCLELDGITRIAKHKMQCYLAHNPETAVWPVRNGLRRLRTDFGPRVTKEHIVNGRRVQDVTQIATQVDLQDIKGLFTPTRTRAPILLPFETQYDAVTDPSMHTVWRFHISDGEVLAHGTRVSIQSMAVSGNKVALLTVYRNQQGVFLPTMTSDEGPSYWRLLKCTKDAQQGEPFLDGEIVRLSWCFADQTSGFRDFYEDSFGRRRFTKPAGVLDRLYLKVPFPRFEVTTERGMALVMSTIDAPLAVNERIKVRPLQGEEEQGEVEVMYNLHDLSFRLDAVVGKGANDYMIQGVDQNSNGVQELTSLTWESLVERKNLPDPLQIVAKSLLGIIAPGPLAIGSFFKSLF